MTAGEFAVGNVVLFFLQQTGYPAVVFQKIIQNSTIHPDFEIVRVPVTESGPSRAGRYHITDPYLRFYFRFLADRQYQLALGAQNIALAEITRHMIDFIGRYTWEELCREWVLRASAFGELSVLSDHVGSAWNSKVQIDVAGINSMEKTLVLGECKWTLSKIERKVIADLIEERAARIIPARGKWRVYFLGFSRSGWTSGALAYQHKINQHPVQGENWESIGLRLVTVDELDDDMTRWTK